MVWPDPVVNDGVAQRWIARARPGVCGVTEEGVEGLCGAGDQGSFGGWAFGRLLKHGGNWTAAAAACLERCARCERCRFVTLNIGRHFDCSWYASCELSRLMSGRGHVSGKAPWLSKAPISAGPGWQPRCPRPSRGGTGRCNHVNATVVRRCGSRVRHHKPVDVPTHAAWLRQWAACNEEASVGGSGTSDMLSPAVRKGIESAGKDAAYYATFEDHKLLLNLPLAAAGFDPQTAASHAVAASAPCLTPACVVRALASKWIVFYGDSTMRMMFGGLLGLLATRYGARLEGHGPTLGGEQVAGGLVTGQCDYDVWATLPPLPAHLPPPPYASRLAEPPPALVSMRFLRGLDLHKLRHNARQPHRRLFYPFWNERSRVLRTQLLLEADAPEAPLRHRIEAGGSVPTKLESVAGGPGSAWTESAPCPMLRRPDVVVFHSCAWDMPRVNRSSYYYPDDAGPERGCTEEAGGEEWVDARLQTRNATGAFGTARARTLGAGCRVRGDGLTDEEIYHGYEQSLREALSLLQAQSAGTDALLLVRNCHAGSGTANRKHRGESESQHGSVLRMNEIIARVAGELCVPVLDVHALDAAAGFYWQEDYPADFHAPPIAAFQAALAMLLTQTQHAQCAHRNAKWRPTAHHQARTP